MLQVVLRIDDRPLAVERLRLASGLRRPTISRIVPAGSPRAIELEMPGVLALADAALGERFEFSLQVSDFDLADTGADPDGRIDLCDRVVSPAEPFALEVFGSAGGISLTETIESRCALSHVPVALEQDVYPLVIVSRISFLELLDELCARYDVQWRVESDSLWIGQPGDGPLTEVKAIRQRRCPAGTWIATDRWIAPGRRVQSRGVEGIVLEASLDYQRGRLANVGLLVGDPQPPRRAIPWCLHRLAGWIGSVEPFTARIDSGRGGQVEVESHFMVRRDLAGDFQETLPLHAGDPLLVEIPVGGLCTEVPASYAWSPGPLSEAYVMQSGERIDQLASWSSRVQRDWEIDLQTMNLRAQQVDIHEQ